MPGGTCPALVNFSLIPLALQPLVSEAICYRGLHSVYDVANLVDNELSKGHVSLNAAG